MNKELTLSERFTNSVLREYKSIAKSIEITDKEYGLIANYFIKIDEMLRNSKQGYTWQNIRMKEFSTTLAHMAKIGLDMTIPNTLSFIPFKYKDTHTVNMVPVIGANGYQYLAMKFGINPPRNVVIELVYETDEFYIIKKDAKHAGDSYTFNINNPFNRGKIVGAFGFLEFRNQKLDKVIALSKEQLLKYRPAKYDATFWTGENEKKMLEKTMAKHILKKVVLDPEKINRFGDSISYLENNEIDAVEQDAKENIDVGMCSGKLVDIDIGDVEVDNAN